MRFRSIKPAKPGRCLPLVLTAAFFLTSATFDPAKAERLPKVGYLGFGAAVPPILFQNRIRELGYSEGKDFTVEYRFADGRPENLLGLARELVDAKVDVILALGDEAIVAAKGATRTVPIVMVACDAVTTGFVESLARPGGNLTGLTCLTSEFMPKRLAVFRELCRRRRGWWSCTTRRTSASLRRRRAPSSSRKNSASTLKQFSSARPRTSRARSRSSQPIIRTASRS